MVPFSKEKSLEVKGLGVVLLLLHHLFSFETDTQMPEVRFLLLNQETASQVAAFCKSCVALFLFVTAYGMTLKFKETEGKKGEIARVTLKKYVSLLLTFLFVFVFSHIVWLIFGQGSNLKLYGSDFSAILFFLFDAIGISYFYGSPMLNATWWYMPVIFAALLVLPLLWKVYKQIGWGLVPAAMLLPTMFCLPSSYGTAYLLTMSLAMCAADRSWLEKIAGMKWSASVAGKAGKIVAEILLIYVIYRVRTNVGYEMLMDGVFAFIAADMVYEFLGRVPVLGKVLRILGKNSMNIFLTHSLLMLYLFRDFIYSFRYSLLIFAVLLLLSLAVSYMIELMKKICRFSKLHQMIMTKMDSMSMGD
ncbi:MAG: acyltransferase family protein [Lachnospiraceae bacterium]